MNASIRPFVLYPITTLRRIVDITLTLAIVSTLILFGLQFPHSSRLETTWLIVQLHHFGDPVIAGVGSWFSINWPPSSSLSLLPIGVALGVWGIKIVIDAAFMRTHKLVSKLLPQPAVAAGALGTPELAELGGDVVTADSEQERGQLLKRYREIEKALKTSKRKQCSFLSIDVVGSTQMKVGEKETDIAATFQAYEEMLRKVFEQYGAWKQAWTPDGVMICFLQPELAVGAAQRILRSLKKFNEAENKLRTPFSVRSGLNIGEVPIFEDSKLEKVADHVIDVAGHMQKQGSPDTLWLGADLYNLLTDKAGFHPTGKVVDGYEAYEWTPEVEQPVAES